MTQMSQMMEAVLYQDEALTREIIRVSFDIHNNLGYGFLEKIYENALAYELTESGLHVEQQKALKVMYKGREMGMYYSDLIVEGKVLLELKTNDRIRYEHGPQLLNYLKATGIKVGLLINFGKSKVEFRRYIY